ncbi:MAG TPA: 2-amino-4-hydroxy-6-hydroxymethyldihydropteridine diphosphokinase [Longimicrobiales bacterium]
MARVYLGVGTNLGDREANLRTALRRLGALGRIAAVSSVYRSEPVGHRPQPDFWNLVVELETVLTPEALLREAQRVEAELGRVRSFRNAPRPMDIDLLLYDDGIIDSPVLTVPHPRMMERGFVLRPLVEIAPGLRHPVTGERFADRLARAEGLERTERLFPGERLLEERGDR